METNGLAIQFGVALPETSKKLDWQERTIFYWAGLHSGNEKDIEYFISYLIEDEGIEWVFVKERNRTTKRRRSDLSNIIPAPQMHEIAKVLPPTWTLDGWANHLHFENSQGDEPTFLEYVKNNHFAEVFAKLYIKLKQAGLLEK